MQVRRTATRTAGLAATAGVMIALMIVSAAASGSAGFDGRTGRESRVGVQENGAIRVVAEAVAAAARQIAGTERVVTAGLQVGQSELTAIAATNEDMRGAVEGTDRKGNAIELIGVQLINLPPPARS